MKYVYKKLFVKVIFRGDAYNNIKYVYNKLIV